MSYQVPEDKAGIAEVTFEELREKETDFNQFIAFDKGDEVRQKLVESFLENTLNLNCSFCDNNGRIWTGSGRTLKRSDGSDLNLDFMYVVCEDCMDNDIRDVIVDRLVDKVVNGEATIWTVYENE